ncbi:hypothetical protein CH330_07415 [candidate division WOR-3 bacterium JGI_Cruoil_03_51_56]|uniref:DUF2520 domain-containing protein n=1 Tax=candidate division WOR-3 bacterium JGI_Cruoil_03_51_56 TaxID=1973747 RepID=A0A235BRL0_UNCW3|nr:MAG: hypothetical protein CH330_07415 [candidate division WOR-3 bacterium JGI_Cruoil_03_51_56]
MSNKLTGKKKLRAGLKARHAGYHRVGFIGAGRVGSAMAWHCNRLGFETAGVTDKKPKQAWVVYGLLKIPYVRLKPSDVAAASDVFFLTVPDRHIEPEFVAIRRWLRPKTIVAHCSGVLGNDVFKGAKEQGLETLALHPIQSFSSHAQAIRSLPGSFFALEGSAAGLRFGRRLVRLLRGGCVVIRGPDRPLYHAMCVFASNFENALIEASENLAGKLGISRRRAAKMLAPLMRTVLENAVEYGAVPSLTGPVQRGDAMTVAQHLDALTRRAPELLPMYRTISLHLVDIARQQGLSTAAARQLRSILRIRPKGRRNP